MTAEFQDILLTETFISTEVLQEQDKYLSLTRIRNWFSVQEKKTDTQ